MEVITKVIKELSEECNKKPVKLNETIHSMNEYFSKPFQSRKIFQSKIQETENHSENLYHRNVQEHMKISNDLVSVNEVEENIYFSLYIILYITTN